MHKIATTLLQFCFLHAYFWMSALSWNIFHRFYTTRFNLQQTKNAHDGANCKKLLAYVTYTVGAPVLIIIATAAVEFTGQSRTSNGFILPIYYL